MAGDLVRLESISERALLVSPVRILLGLGLLAPPIAVSTRPAVAFVAFAFGAVGLAFAALTDPRRRFFAPTAREQVPADAVYATRPQMTRAAAFPSTVGVTALSLVALPFSGTLASLLAGAVAGLGLASLTGGGQLLLLERRTGVRLYAEHDGRVVYERCR